MFKNWNPGFARVIIRTIAVGLVVRPKDLEGRLRGGYKSTQQRPPSG